MKIVRKRTVVVAGVAALAVAIVVPVVYAWSQSGSLTAADKQMQGRLRRDDIQSTCRGKANPGLLDEHPRRIRTYDVYRHKNTSGHPACFNVTLDAHACHNNALAQANSPFSPLNPSSHYLGDAGWSYDFQNFWFPVGSGQSFDVVVGQVDPTSTVCNYVLTVNLAP